MSSFQENKQAQPTEEAFDLQQFIDVPEIGFGLEAPQPLNPADIIPDEEPVKDDDYIYYRYSDHERRSPMQEALDEVPEEEDYCARYFNLNADATPHDLPDQFRSIPDINARGFREQPPDFYFFVENFYGSRYCSSNTCMFHLRFDFDDRLQEFGKICDEIRYRDHSEGAWSIDGDRIKISFGIRRNSNLTQKESALLLTFYSYISEDYVGRNFIHPSPRFHTACVAPNISNVNPRGNTLGWVKAALEVQHGIIANYYGRDYSVAASEFAYKQLGRHLANPPPKRHFKERNLALTEKRKKLIDSAEKILGGFLKPELLYLILNRGEFNDPKILGSPEFKRFAQFGSTYLNNGLVIERVVEAVKFLRKQGSSPFQSVQIVCSLVESIFSDPNRPWWYIENSPLISSKIKPSEHAELAKASRCAFGVAADLLGVMREELTKIPGAVAKEQFKPEILKLVSYCADTFGIGDLSRAQNAIRFAIRYLKEGKAADLEERTSRIIAYMDERKPLTRLIGLMQGKSWSLLGDRLPRIIGNYLGEKKLPEITDQPAHKLLGSAVKLLSAPIEQRKRLQVMVPYGVKAPPLLGLYKTEEPKLKLLSDGAPRTLSKNTTPLSTWLDFEERVKAELRNSAEDCDYVVGLYFKFCAAQFPDPFNPPEGFLEFLNEYQDLPIEGVEFAALFAPSQRGAIQRKNLEKKFHRYGALTALLALPHVEVCSWPDVQKVFDWILCEIPAEEKKQIEIDQTWRVGGRPKPVGPNYLQEVVEFDEKQQSDIARFSSRLYGKETKLSPAQAHCQGLEMDPWILRWQEQAFGNRRNLLEAYVRTEVRHGMTVEDYFGRERNHEPDEDDFRHAVSSALRDLQRETQSARMQIFDRSMHLICGFLAPASREVFGPEFSKKIGRCIFECMTQSANVDDFETRINSQYLECLNDIGLSKLVCTHLLKADKVNAILSGPEGVKEKLTCLTEILNEAGRTVYIITQLKKLFNYYSEELDSRAAILEELKSRAKDNFENGKAPEYFELDFEKIFERELDECDEEFARKEALGKFDGLIANAQVSVLGAEAESGRYSSAYNVQAASGAAVGMIIASNLEQILPEYSPNITARPKGRIKLIPNAAGVHSLALSNQSLEQIADRISAGTSAIRERLIECRKLAFHLLPIGGKIHVHTPIRDRDFYDLIQRFKLPNSTAFKLLHANHTLLLPPTPSGWEISEMVRYLTEIGLVDPKYPELQTGTSGRLPPSECAYLGATLLIGSPRVASMNRASFATSHNKDVQMRIITYDAGAPNLEMPFISKVRGRTDKLGGRHSWDIFTHQLVATILDHGVNGGPFAELAKPFKLAVEQALAGAKIEKVLDASWVWDRQGPEAPNAGATHFREAISPCIKAREISLAAIADSSSPVGIYHEINRIVEYNRGCVTKIQEGLLTSADFAEERRILLFED